MFLNLMMFLFFISLGVLVLFVFCLLVLSSLKICLVEVVLDCMMVVMLFSFDSGCVNCCEYWMNVWILLRWS